MSNTLPDWLVAELQNCPLAGGGVHKWLFSIARQLLAHYSAEEVVRLLAQATANCGRRVSHREIVEAVNAAAKCAWQPTRVGTTIKPNFFQKSERSLSEPTWPKVNDEQREAILKHRITLVDLWELSPFYFEQSSTAAILDVLYPGDPLLCVGRYLPSNATEHYTRKKSEWLNGTGHAGRLLGNWELIVPTPRTAVYGITQEDKQSQHAKEAAGKERRFLVIEFDEGSFEDHATLLVHLSQFGPLVMVVCSGGKSLHGWFYCAGVPEDTLHRFMRYAVSVGGDDALWCTNQFARLPDGLRGNGNRQSVLYFNPHSLEVNQ